MGKTGKDTGGWSENRCMPWPLAVLCVLDNSTARTGADFERTFPEMA